MKRIFLSLFILNYSFVFSQVYPNIGFESGNLNGWNAYTGQCCPVYISANGINSLNHAITTGNGTDMYTGGVVPVVAPGNIFSAKLGNDIGGSEAERLSYTFTVSQTAPLLIYQYAVVFQFPANHPPSKQPRFEAVVIDSNNKPIPCTYYTQVAANSIPGFNPVYEIRYKNWADAAIDLTDYIGQTVTLQFSTGDCGMGGHFGYAYLDAFATEMKIKDSICDINGAITLTAPVGFSSYQWSTGESTPQIKLSNVKAGDVITINLLSTTGCEYALQYVVPDFVPTCAVAATQLCNSKFHIEGTSSVTGFIIDSSVFVFDNQSTTQSSFDYDFINNGTFPLIYIAYGSNNCIGKLSMNLVSEKTLTADFVFDEMICPNQLIHFLNKSQSTSDKIKSYSWDFDSYNLLSLENPEFIFSSYGNYPVELTVESENGCTGFIEKQVNVLSEDDCIDFSQLYFPNSFSPNNDGKNDLYEIKSYHGEMLRLEIFNRWGELVCKSSGNNVSWNGNNLQNKKVQEGLYPAVITVANGNDLNKKTINVFLIR